MKTRIDAFCLDEEGVTAIEYALLGALIVVVIVVSVTLVGTNLGDLYDRVATEIKDALS